MKKLVAFSKDKAIKFTAKLGDVVDNIFSGGVPFVPPIPTGFPGRVSATEAMMVGQSERSFREALGAQQAAYMGGLGGQLLNQLMGYRPYETKPASILKEGKVSVQVKFTRIDKEHVLVEVECIQRIVHNNKELREVTANLIEEYAEQYLFQAPIAKNPRAPEHEPGTMMKADAAAKELIQVKPGHE